MSDANLNMHHEVKHIVLLSWRSDALVHHQTKQSSETINITLLELYFVSSMFIVIQSINVTL